jgi:hypothetical protein
MVSNVYLPFSRFVRGGSMSAVFRYDKLAIKCPLGVVSRESDSEDVRSYFMDENRMQEALHAAGVNVSRVYGIEDVNAQLADGTIVSTYGIVMDFINGIRLSDLPRREGRKNQVSMKNLELELSVKLGFKPALDAYTDSNSIWSFDDGKVYLIDFGNWEFQK